MSKKKKFKNKFKSEIFKQLQEDLANNQINNQIDKSEQNQQSAPKTSLEYIPAKNPLLDNNDSKKYDYVKKDLIKIAFIVILIIIILITVTIINQRFETISNWSDSITNFLHINQ